MHLEKFGILEFKKFLRNKDFCFGYMTKSAENMVLISVYLHNVVSDIFTRTCSGVPRKYDLLRFLKFNGA